MMYEHLYNVAYTDTVLFAKLLFPCSLALMTPSFPTSSEDVVFCGNPKQVL